MPRCLPSVARSIVTATLVACVGWTAQAVPAAATAGDLHPKGPTVSGLTVDRVVDGDTLHVTLDGTDVTVRMIGINSPESVKPDSPIECYGPEASDYAKAALTGRQVTLEFDRSQGRTDPYGRTLAYVWLEQPDGSRTLFNLRAVQTGNARERQYVRTPYAWKKAFTTAQRRARAAHAGLWGACPS